MSQQNVQLKQPIGIYILAILFMFAPVGNILISFAGSGVENWYQPSEFANLIATIPWMDWLWLGGIFISGLALFVRHKSAWLVAVLVLLLVLGMNTYRAFTIDDSVLNPEFVRMQILVSILVTFSVLIIAFYARYPYLDRRQGWIFPTAKRYNVQTAVTLHVGNGLQAKTDSLSASGVRVILEQIPAEMKNIDEVEISFPEIDNTKLKANVIEHKDKILRLQFKGLAWGGRSQIETWLKSKKS